MLVVPFSGVGLTRGESLIQNGIDRFLIVGIRIRWDDPWLEFNARFFREIDRLLRLENPVLEDCVNCGHRLPPLSGPSRVN
jgi:hypothetical protein